MMKYILAATRTVLLSGGLLVLAPWVSGTAQAESIGPMCPGAPEISRQDQIRLDQQIINLDRTTRTAYAELPFEELRVDAAQQALGDDPEVLFRWVRDETRWLPYVGALRGADGVMLDRMGSSLDRSLLLAALLEEAGHAVRLAHAELPQDVRETLYAAWRDVSLVSRLEVALEQATDSEAIALLAEHLGLSPAELAASIAEQSEAAEERLSRLLAASHRQTEALSELFATHLAQVERAAHGSSEQGASRQGENEQHWWVQYHNGTGWLDLDPALPGQAFGEPLITDGAAAHHYPEALPEAEQHWLTIEVVAERLERGRLHEEIALRHRLPAAVLPQQTLQLETYPLGLPALQGLVDGSQELAALPQQIFAQEQWAPYLRIGDSLERDKLINADGSVETPGQQTSTSAAFGEASNILGSIGVGGHRQDDAEPAELTAVLVRLYVDAPGRQQDRFERPLMDLLGPEQRAREGRGIEITQAMREQRAVALLSTLELLGQTTWLPPAQLAALSYAELLQGRQPALAAAHLGMYGDDSFIGAALTSVAPRRHALDQLAAMRLAYSPYPEQVALTRLNLLGYVRLLDYQVNPGQADVEQAGEGQEGQFRQREGFDIIDNRVAVPSGEKVFATRLAQGALDTLLEAEIAVAEKAALSNTARAFLHDLEAGREWHVIQQLEELESLDWQPDADLQAHLDELFVQGQAVAMPVALAADGVPTWWQLDPESGDLLGYGPDRRGQYVEALLTLISAGDSAMGAVGMVQSIWNCLFTSSDPLCCTQQAATQQLINSAVSQGLGGLAKAHDVNIIIGRELIEGGAFDRLNSAGISKAAGDVTGWTTDFIFNRWGSCQ